MTAAFFVKWAFVVWISVMLLLTVLAVGRPIPPRPPISWRQAAAGLVLGVLAIAAIVTFWDVP